MRNGAICGMMDLQHLSRPQLPTATPRRLEMDHCKMLGKFKHTCTIHNLFFRLLFSVQPIQNFSICLFVRNQFNETIPIEANALDTVMHLKTKLYYMEGIPPDEQILVYQVKTFDDNRTFADYGIDDFATLDLRLRICGGAVSIFKEIFWEIWVLCSVDY
jgi:hypothetical protein